MRYLSTRNPQHYFSLSAAIKSGLAPDGGLFLPEQLVKIAAWEEFENLTYPKFAVQLLKPFFHQDVLEEALEDLCTQSFSFEVPLRQLNENSFSLELFHGPTCSFKDFGAGFLAACLSALGGAKSTILVATSGDTGSAVANAFYRKEGVKVIILYPEGQISSRQEQQMTCWGENIFSLAVAGSFDQCQQLVKAAFQDPLCQSLTTLSSANSINIGRLLPQITYYAYSSLQFYKNKGEQPGYIIPSGNLGNATAAYWAKALGFPIREIVIATNANRVIADYLERGYYQPLTSIPTLASAMDVGNPSNLERLERLFSSFDEIKQAVKVFSVSDEEIRQAIKACYQRHLYVCCPHTATAYHLRQRLDQKPWIIVATAAPSKFDTLIEPLIETEIPIAPALKRTLDKPQHRLKIKPCLGAIQELLEQNP